MDAEAMAEQAALYRRGIAGSLALSRGAGTRMHEETQKFTSGELKELNEANLEFAEREGRRPTPDELATIMGQTAETIMVMMGELVKVLSSAMSDLVSAKPVSNRADRRRAARGKAGYNQQYGPRGGRR